jgi:hypothetical protein
MLRCGLVRTTVTLDPDTEQIIRRTMRERDLSFKEALNETIRAAARNRDDARPFRTATAAMGRSAVSLDRALQLAADLEDDELIHKMRRRS